MKENLNYIDILLKIKTRIPSENGDLPVNPISHKNFNDTLSMLLSQSNIKNDFCCNNESVSYSKEIENFLLALIASFKIIDAQKRTSIKIDDDILKGKPSSLHKIAFNFSKFRVLFSNKVSFNNKNKVTKTNDKESNDDEFNDEGFDDEEFSDENIGDSEFKIKYKAKNMSIECDELLSQLCSVILCNVDNYPYIFPFCYYFETDMYKNIRHHNKNRKKTNNSSKANDLLEYLAQFRDPDVPECFYITEKLACKLCPVLNIFTGSIRRALLTVGGVEVIEFLNSIFMQDPTYHNPNLKDPKYSKKFYSFTYKNFLRDIYNNNDDVMLKLFHYCSIENILEGIALFSFCNTFSSNIWDKFFQKTKIFNKEKGNEIISNIFDSINSVNNPFLKVNIIENILDNSYYSNYCYNGKEYTAGKEDINKWCEFIKDYCFTMCQIEKDIYPILLKYLYNNPKNNYNESLKAYETFFSKYMYSFTSNKIVPLSRSKRFDQLLKTALIASYNDRNSKVLCNLLPNK